MFTRWSMMLSFAMVGIVAWACYALMLPGQRTLPLTVTDVSAFSYAHSSESYELEQQLISHLVKEGDSGLKAFAPLKPSKFDFKAVPDPLAIDITLGNRVSQSWQVRLVFGYAGPVKEHIAKLRDPDCYMLPGNFEPAKQAKRVHWDNLNVSKEYTLEVVLHQYRTGEKSVSPEELKAIISENDTKEGLSINVLYPANE
jgi:hypothetical protein